MIALGSRAFCGDFAAVPAGGTCPSGFPLRAPAGGGSSSGKTRGCSKRSGTPRKRLWQRGWDLVCPHRRGRRRPKTQDGRKLRRDRRRWKIERTIGWLQFFRRRVVRYEHDSFLYQGFLHLACIAIRLRRFWKPALQVLCDGTVAYFSRHNDFRYSISERRSSTVRLAPYSCPPFPLPGNAVSNS